MTGTSTALVHASDAPGDVQRAVAAANVLKAAHPELAVRIIVNGPALTGLTNGEPIEPDDGVRVEACSLGLAQRQLAPELLADGVTTVPQAVVAIVDAQLHGAAYVRI